MVAEFYDRLHVFSIIIFFLANFQLLFFIIICFVRNTKHIFIFRNISLFYIADRLEILQSEEAVVDKDTGKVGVELRCGSFPSQSPSYPIEWQVQMNIFLFKLAQMTNMNKASFVLV